MKTLNAACLFAALTLAPVAVGRPWVLLAAGVLVLAWVGTSSGR